MVSAVLTCVDREGCGQLSVLLGGAGCERGLGSMQIDARWSGLVCAHEGTHVRVRSTRTHTFRQTLSHANKIEKQTVFLSLPSNVPQQCSCLGCLTSHSRVFLSWLSNIAQQTVFLSWLSNVPQQTVFLSWLSNVAQQTVFLSWLSNVAQHTVFLSWLSNVPQHTVFLSWLSDVAQPTVFLSWLSNVPL